ncbi:uncharacterized protein KIAA1143 homolog [Pseudoliparis swirei]|uniref:uncharacterized protein KIAA1143 homolog n=1 Tax=Pseudoliparis swirei TaxID=2059687 RepID=UPI0024BDBC27|nr:uncharacterized protein KIAA1143 homolog [Pseudoliparis swirei]
MNRSKASGVSWVKPAEPSFLKKFKNDIGYKEGANVDTKRQAMPTLDDDSGSDQEDELPQIVVLKGGDMSAEEVKKMKGDVLPGEKEDKPPADGKILFKKPAKRSSSDKFQGITASSSKKKKKSDGAEEEEEEKEEGDEGVEAGEEEKKEGKSGKTVKNSLLSFGDDEEDED